MFGLCAPAANLVSDWSLQLRCDTTCAHSVARSNAWRIPFTLQLRLPHQFIDWTSWHWHILYINYHKFSNQLSTSFQQFANLVTGHLSTFHLSWPTTELASLSASPKGLGISKNFGADATCCGNISATALLAVRNDADYTETLYQCFEIYSLRLSCADLNFLSMEIVWYDDIMQ